MFIGTDGACPVRTLSRCCATQSNGWQNDSARWYTGTERIPRRVGWGLVRPDHWEPLQDTWQIWCQVPKDCNGTSSPGDRPFHKLPLSAKSQPVWFTTAAITYSTLGKRASKPTRTMCSTSMMEETIMPFWIALAMHKTRNIQAKSCA